MCWLVPVLTPVMLCGSFAYALEVVAVDRSNREVKRFANNAMSPILTNLLESSSGRVIIREMGYSELFVARQAGFVDDFNAYNFFAATAVAWGMVRLSARCLA